jgi:hypothetical protein
MKLPELEAMRPRERRRFLKAMGALLGAWGAGPALRFAADEVSGGEAYAQAMAQSTLFLEVGLRDQWDQGHVMVAPGLATNAALRRGDEGTQAALFYGSGELREFAVNGTRAFLTADSAELAPHLDSIAFLDCNELAQGNIHGHESANPCRAPGRSYQQTAGKLPMFQNDPVSNFPQGCEAYYASTPTPATLHNFVSKQADPSLKNGMAFKGISRSIHTVYHHAAGLPGAELDRRQSRSALFAAYPDSVEDFNVLRTPQQAQAFTRILQRLDAKALADKQLALAAREGHLTTLTEAQKQLYVGQPRVIHVPLTAQEEALWGSGVPAQVAGGPSKAQLWEQMGWAHKLLSNGLARSVALEFDYLDHHGGRGESLVRTEAQQLARPLARLITQLKAQGLWERTLIAVYTVDGSRAVSADSYGNEGKNTVILAGGKIRGGYFGDLRVAGNSGAGHSYSYHAPDDSGAPGPGRTDGRDRTPGARVWRTVMKALGVSDAVCAQFPDVAQAAPLPFALKS